jgi:hypothetical protein
MKTLLHISSPSSRYLYHRQWGGTKNTQNIELGTVGAEQQEIQEAAELWNEFNTKTEENMSEVRASVMERIRKESHTNFLAPHAWQHKRR